MKFFENLLWFIIKFIWNILWLPFGLIGAVLWAAFGLVFCVTIILIPFGIQCFKNAWFTLTPFGKEIFTSFGEYPIINILWLFPLGLIVAFINFLIGSLLYATIILIPLGHQCFKLGVLALAPYGADFDRYK